MCFSFDIAAVLFEVTIVAVNSKRIEQKERRKENLIKVKNKLMLPCLQIFLSYKSMYSNTAL